MDSSQPEQKEPSSEHSSDKNNNATDGAGAGATTESIVSASCTNEVQQQPPVMTKNVQAATLTSNTNVNSIMSSSQRSHRSRKVNSSKPGGGATASNNQSTVNSRGGGGKHGGASTTNPQQQRAEYHPPSASSKQTSGHTKNQRSVRSTNKDGGVVGGSLLLEESKQLQQAATLASCQSNNSIAGGCAAMSKKGSAISILSSSNAIAAAAQNNSKAAAISNKAVMKNSKKQRNQNKAGCTTGSVNSSAAVADDRKSHSRQKKNRNRIMIKSTSSVSVRDEAAPSEKIKNNTKSYRVRGGSSHRAEGRDKVASSDMLKSSIRPSMKSISNWNQSQRSDKRSNSYKQKTISQQAIENIIGQNDASKQPQDMISPELIVEGQDIENTNGQEGSQMSSPATNMPASPASKAPTLKSSAVHSPPAPLNIDREQNDRIDELAEQECSPTSAADPIAAAAGAVRLNNTNMNTNSYSAAAGTEGNKMTAFGIKLKKLEISNMSVTKQNSIVDATPQSIIHEQTPKQVQEVVKLDKDGKVVRPEMTEPLPILPKMHTVINLPVKCPIENIRFLNLKRFLQFQKQVAEQMAAGYDLVGQRRKMLQRQTEDKLKKNGAGIEQLAKIDDTTHFIKSVVYARDPKIIDQERNHVPQRDAFQHLNNLDVKMLIQKSQIMNAEEGKFASLSPRTRRLPAQNQNRQFLDSQVYRLKDSEDRTLIFESRFESGNLYLAQKVSEIEYNLLMQNDINTQGHTQWFFFQVKNTRAGNKVKFNILNYSKPDSLFNYGMKVSVYSDKKSEEHNIGWHKDCEEVSYFMNGIRKDVTNYARSYYTATFTYTFEYDDDTVYFAYSVPYTYSDLRNDLAAIESDPHRSKLVRKATLCRTLSGEQCEVLTITSADNLQNFSKRKGVVITARVHPGETVGSWMMRGVLTFLTDPDNFEARMLRENFVFKVVPMLNPDGVINGNYRCSLAGCDLNRRWKVPNKTLHPTIWHTKRLVKSIHQERGLVMFCDLHGHSRKQNVFMYGCNNKNNPGECRIFPFILGQMNPYFCYEYSRFGVQKSKEATARVALYKELVDVPNIFTMESSFAGCDEGPAAGKHLTTDMLETLGHDCCRAILIYCNMHVPPELQEIAFFKNIFLQQQAAKNKQKSGGDLDKKKFKEPAFDLKDAINSELNANKALLAGSGGDDSSSGSDSAPSEDNMQAEELVKQLPVADKTLKQQLKKNEQKRKQEDKEKAQAEQSQAKLRKQSSLRKEDRDAPKRQLSPLKRAPANPQQDKNKEDGKAEEKKKPKVETRDACTQTDRSDYQLIKQKMLKERQLKEEQAALAQNQQMRAKAGVSTERQLINDLNGNNRQNNHQEYKKTQSFNTTQRLQQMVGLGDGSQVRMNQNHQKQMPLSSHFSQNPLMNQIQGQYNRNGNPLSHPQSTRNEQSSLLGLGGMPSNQQNMNLPDKKKYNFMGVSSINNQSGAPQTTIQENEYGTMQPPNTEPTPNHVGMFQNNNSELPSMTGTLSANSSKQGGNKPGGVMVKNQSQIKQGQQQYMSGPGGINGKLSVNNQKNSADQGGAPQRMRNDLAFSPMRKGTGGPGQNSINTKQLSLPQAKQLPQKEFVMLEVGKAAKGVRKGSRNPKSNSNNLMLLGSQNPNNLSQAATPLNGGAQSVGHPPATQHHYNSMSKQFNNSTGNHRQLQPALSSEQSEHQDTQSSRFKRSQLGPQTQQQQQQHVVHGGAGGPPGQVPQKQLAHLVRNNSVVLQNNNSAGGTAASSGNHNSEATPVFRSSPADQYSSQLQEMTLSQTLVNRNTPATLSNSAQKHGGGNAMNGNSATHSAIEPSSENAQYRAALSGALGQQAQNSSLARYKAAVGNDGKLPALNVRGGGNPQQQQPKTGRSEFANSSGVIGGLNIVLNSGQGTLQTPQQKKPNPPTFQMSAHSQKINSSNGGNGQPQQPMKMIGPSMLITSSHTASTNQAGAMGPGQQPPSSVNRTKSDSKTSMHKQSTSTNSVSRQQKQHWQSHTCENPASSVQGPGLRSNQLGAGSSLQIQTSSATHKRNASRPIFIGPQTTTVGGGQGLQPGSLSHESGQITIRQQAEHQQNRDMQSSSPVMFSNIQMASAAGQGGGTNVSGPSTGGGAANKKQRTHLLSNNSMSGASNTQLQGKVVGKRYSRH